MSNLAHFGSRVIKLTHPNKGQKRQSSLWFHYWRTCGLVHIFTFIIENSNKDWIKVSSSTFQIIWFWICFHQKILSRSRSGDAAVYSRQWQIEFWDFARANFYKVRKWEIKRISSFLETFSQKKTFCGFLRRLEYIKNNFTLKSEREICKKKKMFCLKIVGFNNGGNFEWCKKAFTYHSWASSVKAKFKGQTYFCHVWTILFHIFISQLATPSNGHP